MGGHRVLVSALRALSARQLTPANTGPTVSMIPLLPVERALDGNSASYRSLRNTDVVKRKADSVRVDPERSHSFSNRG